MKRASKGAVALEFLIIVPILMVFLLGIIQFGSLLFVRQEIYKIAYNGVRLAAINSNATNEGIHTYLEQELQRINVYDAQIDLSPEDISTAERGSLLTVTIDAPLNALPLASFPVNFTQSHMVISASMAKEY